MVKPLPTNLEDLVMKRCWLALIVLSWTFAQSSQAVGSLLVASTGSNQVLSYDFDNGAFLE